MGKSLSRGVLPTAACGAALFGSLAVVARWSKRRRRSALAASSELGHAHCMYPKQYVAPKGTPPRIDGDVFKAEWERAPWSEAFGEIRGADAPEGSAPRPTQATRVKMLWDEQYLYIAALMDLEEGQELTAKFAERNSPIFHTDVDFEVFVDGPGCCHNYKELELNAINTVWNLMLDKPYSDGGGEWSGREHKEGDLKYWEVRGQRTATRVLKGALHDASKPSQWCCEVAIAHSDTLDRMPVAAPVPAVGNFFRINFSRVESKGAVNWTWAPQVIWDPAQKAYKGQVNMHLPDAYGYVLFADSRGELPSGTAGSWCDPAWSARLAAMNLYYVARAYNSNNRRYPSALADMDGLVDSSLFRQVGVDYRAAGAGYSATATSGGWAATVNEERLLRVERL